MSDLTTTSGIDRTRSTALSAKAKETGYLIDQDRADTAFCLETAHHTATSMNSTKTAEVFNNLIDDLGKNSAADTKTRELDEKLRHMGFSGKKLGAELLGEGSTVELRVYNSSGQRNHYIRTFVEHKGHEDATDEDVAGFLDVLVKILRDDSPCEPMDTSEPF